MWQRDKYFRTYYSETNTNRKELLHIKYKTLRNELTKKKRVSKMNYYHILLTIQKISQQSGMG